MSHPFVFTLFSPFAMVKGMKRTQLLKHLKNHGAYLLREGSRHSIYKCADRKTQIPRHAEIVDELARKICKDLEIPFVR
jgi:predicted RNA binding protein YcfA (HicA-like mRNA interferase family)